MIIAERGANYIGDSSNTAQLPRIAYRYYNPVADTWSQWTHVYHCLSTYLDSIDRKESQMVARNLSNITFQHFINLRIDNNTTYKKLIDLNTSNKTSLIEAINEVNDKINNKLNDVVFKNLSDYLTNDAFDYSKLTEDFQNGGFLYADTYVEINGKGIQRNSFMQVSNMFGKFIIMYQGEGEMLQFVVTSSGCTTYVFSGEVVE